MRRSKTKISLPFSRLAAEGFGEEPRKKIVGKFLGLHARACERVRGAKPERAILSRATTRGARGQSGFSAKKVRISSKQYRHETIHQVDNRDSTVQATKVRAQTLQRHRTRILESGTMSKELLAELLPSLTYVRVIHANDDRFYCFEGNGRIAALKSVFTPQDNLLVEVEVFFPKNARRSIKKIQKLRKLHKMV